MGADTVLVFEGQGATTVPGEPELDLTALAPADAQHAIVAHQLGRARAAGGGAGAPGAGPGGVVGVVGQSLGEVSALVVADALDEADALRFVRLRATLPADLLPPRTWTMASMTRLRPDRAAAAADGLDVWTVGRNGPSDAVVVAADGAFDVFADRLGAKPHTYRLLPVTAPYHTPLMAPVAAALADVVAGFAVRDPAVPVLTPTGPGEVRTAAEVRALLVAMLTSPVDWTGVLALGAARWPSARWRECGPSCSLHRFVVKNDLALDWGEA